MRIQAIRGQNLASLAQPFEVDFEAEPIRTAGILAIAGPTGAGKSTLLDAMCLALFDELPRFDHADKQARIGQAGGDEAGAQAYNDVRNVLRHGAAEGFAEVDFVGQDRRSYRARWQVRRARGKADGKLQQQTVTLTDLQTGQPIGDKKTDTLAEIARRVGLSFQQFRRSVLLAQGDFDTFIKADAKSRAELLERITGTQIYAELSRAAFERRKAEQQAIKLLEDRGAEIRPLEPDARIALEAAEQEAAAALAALDRERSELSKASAWHGACARLKARVAEAEEALRAAVQADEALAPARAELEAGERAFALRAEWDDAGRCAAELRERQEAMEAAGQAARTAAAGEAAANAARGQAERELAERRTEAQRLAPLLQQALGLDQQLAAALAETAEATAEHCRRQDALGAGEAEAERIRAAEGEAAARRDEHQAWLEQHGALALLAPRLDEVLRDLETAAGLEAGIAKLAGQALAGQEASAARAAERAHKEDEARLLENQALALGREIQAARAQAREIDRARVQARLEQAGSAVHQLEALAEAGQGVRRADEALAQLQASAARDAGRADKAQAELGKAQAELPVAKARLDEARRGRDLSEAAAGQQAEHLRTLLVPGQPCPVCGSRKHGEVQIDAVLAMLAEADRVRVQELEEAVGELQRLGSAATARLEEIAAGEAERAARAEAATSDRQRAEARFAAARLELEPILRALDGALPEPPGEPAACDADSLAPHLAAARRLRQEAAAGLERLEELEEALRARQGEQEACRSAKEAVDQWLRQDSERSQSLLLEERAVQERLQAARDRQTLLLDRLDGILLGPVPDWREHCRQDPAALAENCRQQVLEWGQRSLALRELEGEIAKLGAELRACEAVLVHQRQAVTEAGGLRERAERHEAATRAARAQLLDGRKVAEVEAERDEKLARAEQAVSLAAAQASQAVQVRATCAEAESQAGRALEAARSACTTAEARLEAALAARGLGRDQVQAALAKGEGWLADERARLEAARRTLEGCQMALSERADALAEHERSEPPAWNAEEVEEATVLLEARRGSAESAYHAHRAELERDRRVRAEQADLLAQIEARRAEADVWLRLADLIGSADGTRFRRYAQNLTLVQLLHLANRHLAELNPRYELERAPGGDLVLQVVDRYMADEVRGVHSLSGGERFLVSLALALGLASLSSGHGIQVESLFIDEGFGALDANSLSLAVSVLERLQATGRRVAVISHVEELKERIAVKVQVLPQGGGRSTVEVTAS
ncbi:AAA family ATPase [Geminicoccus roseus]|uniref:AAA family ATPase n=1 Tax=Geminicoccus roseus TaxID=404900 RepID=UPI00041405B9|nr:AAA family ATPase [Geminicoccus roseus]